MIRTRFAPSPTGYLHIGGVRTALFNWLLARQAGGQFILRIDDTDQQRNVEEALQPILDGFRWLGMDWDEGPEVDGPHAPYYQSQRADRHREAVDQLLKSGHAYRDFAKPEELQQQREAAEKAGGAFVYDRRWMAETDEQAAAFESEGRAGVVRLKMPREGVCQIDDLVRGEVRVDWAAEQDHVIQRADGSCLYHLATVVDDHDFEITHVVRAAEHLPNTPRQIFIAESLGFELPQFAHLPYVAEPGGSAKLSKRKLDKYLKQRDFAALTDYGKRIADRIGMDTDANTFNPVIVDFYREIGFLPDAILNYLMLLGWSLDGSTERFTREEMIKHFTLARVNKSPASFDPQKLLAFEADHMADFDVDRKVEMALPFLVKAGWVAEADDATRSRVRQIVAAVGDRLKVAGDIIDYEFCFIPADRLTYVEKDFEKRIRKPEEAVGLLKDLAVELGKADDFSVAGTEVAVKAFVEAKGIKIGQIIHALRVATTGQAVGFGMFETLAILGREEVLQRIEIAVNR
ncbi:Glutamate--tRNA ligase 1 [Rosistilla oblonga]|uniref:glutamate--tRNA ligase n=1 Tax=Rosistilla oblonga TaxID=2527990 RepID=UPI00118942D3|nr:glutamate--tRNA ligase [Rosistilla oblonga]QDV11183.1 Glutamate--tRNA ligase 1 [Rosistilla oblonga]